MHRTVDAHPLHSSPSAVTASRVSSVSCVAYLSKGIRRFRWSLSALCPRGLWGGRQASLVFPARFAQLRGCLGPRGALPVLSDAERYAWAWGLLAPFARATHLSIDANDRRSRLEPAAVRPVGSRAGVDVAKECYLVDPASSHMLVSKIKPCMCKYELIQTVKLRMAH